WAGSRERAQFPEFYEWYGRQVGQPLSAPGIFVCTAPVTYRGQEAVQRDIANLKAAVSAAGAGEAFMPSVAVATVAASRPNEYYHSEEEYLQPPARALSQRYPA